MSIAANLQQIQAQVKQAAAKTGRDFSGLKIIAVTKYVGVTEMNEVIRAGITDIGENRVQDAKAKFPFLENPPSGAKLTRHLIGTLQTNKVKAALAEFDLIHSVDRMELVEALAKEAAKLDRRVELLIQLNISGEITKHGLRPGDFPILLDKIKSFQNLVPCGLMTMAPLTDDPEKTRPVFRQLKTIFDETAKTLKNAPHWRYLSMGMSQDYRVAVEEGANLLRIGTAIFKP